MSQIRIIPGLLLRGDGLVGTVRFRDPRYIGDPVDAVRMFNRTEAPGLILFDIMASRKRGLPGPKAPGKPRLDMIARLSDESFVPVAYGGGIRSLEDIRDVLNVGVEKVLINTHAVEDPSFVGKASGVFGSHSITAAMDAKRLADGGYEVYTNGGAKPAGIDPVSHAKCMESMGAGELLVSSIDRDGTMHGYDLPLIKAVARAVSIPVIACGGAGSIEDFGAAIRAGASAVAAGSIFVFRSCRQAMTVSYPPGSAIESMLHGGPETAVAQGK